MRTNGLNTCAGHELIGWNLSYSAKEVFMRLSQNREWCGKEDPNNCPVGFGRAFYVMSHARDKYKKTGYRSLAHAQRINKFAAYVEKHKLGTVVIAPDNGNPVHSNNTILRSAIWTPHQKNLWKHIIQRKFYEITVDADDWRYG